jgi:hypothetical protein
MKNEALRAAAQRLRRRIVPGALLRELRRHVLRVESRIELLERRIGSVQEALGRIEARQLAAAGTTDLHAHEFRVFSQWGEDGILQLLCREVPLPRRVFVEFGVESYEQANTLNLLLSGGWSGLVMEADAAHVARIRAGRVYRSHDLDVVHARVTPENADRLLAEAGVQGDIGVLSIDVDGMDYWIWRGIRSIAPALVVAEYNHRFGPEEAVTVPYDDDFDRAAAPHAMVHYGASLAALARLADRKGYDLVGCGSHGVNAFFVRRDLRPERIPAKRAAEAFVAGGFREAHDEDGRRLDLTLDEERHLARSLPLVHVDGS